MPERTEFESIIRTGREGLAVEFKRGMNWKEPATQGKVIKAALAFTNKRDGGVLVFGMDRVPGQPLYAAVGMERGDYESFDQDGVQALVNAHAAPQIDLSVEHFEFDGKLHVAIVFREFPDYPTICGKDFVVAGKAVVIRGRTYCRSRRMAESTEVQSLDDMREIIELATAKGLERYFRLRALERPVPDSEEAFRKQLGDLGQ